MNVSYLTLLSVDVDAMLSLPAMSLTLAAGIDAVNVHDVHVILDGDPAVVRLGETRFVERLESYVSLQATLREQVSDIDYVDVRFGERVYVGVAQAAGPAPVVRSVPVPARRAAASTQR